MARYIGPKTRIARRFGEAIYGPDKRFDRNSNPPGFHGAATKRKKVSTYGVQLKEKQKVKYTYGILEKQFENLFKKAASKKGITGEILLQFLESRLDNVVYRLGIAPTRDAARQLVSHRHITVNGKVMNVPSSLMRAGDVVAIRERSRSLEVISNFLSVGKSNRFSWLEWDSSLFSGKFMNMPARDEIPENIKEQLIVELYSK